MEKFLDIPKNRIFLAPMAGVADSAFRMICVQMGAGLVYSEMVSAKGLHYGDKKTGSLMKIDEREKPAGIQIFGSDVDIMAEAAEKAHLADARFLDVNMGCPTPKIVNNGDGSALMKDPILAGRIIRKMTDVCKIPVTVKMRKGWDDNNINAVLMAKTAEENGAAAVCVHGRTREQFYRGKADWDIIKDVKKAVKIPVIGNGDIFSAEDAKNMFDYTNCDAVMVGRGSQGNPFIFRQIKEYLEKGRTTYFPSPEERLRTAIKQIKMLCDEKGEVCGVKEARKHIAWYIKGMRESNRLKDVVFKLTSLDDLINVIEEYIKIY